MIQKYYKCSCDWDGKRYCGLTIKWDYASRKVHLSMPTYVKKALQHFQHPPPMIPQNQPHPSIKKTYGAKGISAVCKPSRQSSSTRKSRKEVHPRGHGSIPIFGQSSRWHHVNPPQRSRIRTSKPDGINDGKMPPIPRLCRHPGRRDPHLQSKRHDPCHSQRCLLFIRT